LGLKRADRSPTSGSVRARAPRLPISVLTGFLGSGKTTLLRRLLGDPRLRDAAVIVNELGEVGIDHLVLREVGEDVVVLPSGCLCCTVRQDLVTTLRSLYMRRRRRSIPRFDRILVETTGLADPAPILQTLCKDALIAERFRLDGTIATIDAVNAMDQLDRHRESVKQAAMADRLVITKTDIADAACSATLKARLAAINPSATQLIAIRGEIDAGHLLDAGLYNAVTRSVDVERWLQADVHGRGRPYAGVYPNALTHDDRIRTFCLSSNEPIDWEPFAAAMQALMARHGDGMLRVKGILEVVGEAMPLAVNGVQHVFYPPQHLARWPAGARRSRLVFITFGIEREQVIALLRGVFEPVDMISSERAGVLPTNSDFGESTHGRSA